MSYILDALKRADAERERGTVPGLHTQTYPLDSAAAGAIHRTVPWLGIGMGLTVALLAIMAWRLLGSDAPHETAATAPQVPQPIAEAPIPPPLPVAPPVPTPPTEAKVVVTPPEPAPIKSRPAPATPAAKPKPTLASTPTSAPANGIASAIRVVTRSELPENIRRELPTLTIGGAIHSPNPANRMLIINGQLFHEGDKLAADLTLEQIKLRAAVLKYKEYRYTVSF